MRATNSLNITRFLDSANHADIVPPRLVANVKSGYAEFYDWTNDESRITDCVEEAFRARFGKTDKIDDSMLPLELDKCE